MSGARARNLANSIGSTNRDSIWIEADLRTLVIDTATQALSLALFEDMQCLARDHTLVGRGHAEALVPAIAALPDGGRADRIAVDVGPGSFTGVRIGIAAARALAFAWNVPLAGYSALSLIAAEARGRGMPGDIFVAITGGHGELFWQVFSGDPVKANMPFASTAISDLAAQVGDRIIVGTGAQALVDARGAGEAIVIHPDAAHFPLLPEWAVTLSPRPLYGRGADAKPMAAA